MKEQDGAGPVKRTLIHPERSRARPSAPETRLWPRERPHDVSSRGLTAAPRRGGVAAAGPLLGGASPLSFLSFDMAAAPHLPSSAESDYL